MPDSDGTTKRIPFTCSLDCGGRCELVACVRDGELVRIDTPPNRPDTLDMPRLVPCLRGRAQKRLRNAKERLTSPLRRVGPKGSDQFEKIAWNEALDEVAKRLTDVHDQHGPEAILHLTGAGSFGGYSATFWNSMCMNRNSGLAFITSETRSSSSEALKC